MKRFLANQLRKPLLLSSSVLLSVGATLAISTVNGYADPVYQASCSVSNVPAQVVAGTTIKPKLTVTNTGSSSIRPHMISFVDTANGPTTYFKEKGLGSIAPSQSKTVALGKYTVLASTSGEAQVFAHSDLNYNGTKVFFECYQNFTIE